VLVLYDRTNLVLPIEEPPQVLRHAFPEGALPEKTIVTPS
jgi:hypothetical protein